MSLQKMKICWIPGWGMSPTVWQKVIANLPGIDHVQVDFSSCIFIDDYHKEIKKALQSDPGPWIVVGWSLGGMLALEQVFSAQFRIHALILLSTTLKFEQPHRSQGWPARVIEAMRRQVLVDPLRTLAQFSDMMFSKQEVNQVISQDGHQGVKHHLMLNYLGLDAGLNYLIQTDLRASWKAWRTHPVECRPSVYWLHGTEDQICPIGAIPDDLHENEKKLFVGGGHALMLTVSDQIANQLERWTYAN